MSATTIHWADRLVLVNNFLYPDKRKADIEEYNLLIWYWGRIYTLANNTAELYFALPEQLHMYLPPKEGEVVQDLRNEKIFNIIYERCITNIIESKT